jgi:hypothetical protein
LIDSPTKALEQLHDALDTSSALPLTCLSSDELANHLCSLQQVRSRLEAQLCAATAEAHASGVAALDSQRSVAALVGARTRVDPAVVGSDRATGVWLTRFPEFANAFAVGLIARCHVQLLKAKDNARTHSAMVESQTFFIEQAQHLGWSDFCAVVEYWVLAADPDGEEPKRQVAARRLSMRRKGDGMATGSFDLDPLAGALVRSALGQEAARLLRAESDNPASSEAPPLRSHAQRYVDALVNLVGRGARIGGTIPAPLIHIVLSQRVAEDMITRLACEAKGALLPDDVDPYSLPIGFGDPDQRSELADGTLIHPALALAAVAKSTLRRLVLTAESEIADLGRSVRNFPRYLKDALLAAARGRCDVIGCDAPFAWLEADHYIPWSRGGHTSLSNGRAKCRPHNLEKRDEMPP